MRTPLTCKILLALSLLLSFVLHQQRFGNSPQFVEYTRLNWPNLGPCRLDSSASGSLLVGERVATWLPDKSPHTAKCSSAWFGIEHAIIEIEYAGRGDSAQPNAARISIEVEGLGEVDSLTLPSGKQLAGFRLHRFHLAKNLMGKQARINLVDSSAAAAWLSLRSRLNFYKQGWSSPVITTELPLEKLLIILTAFLLSLTLVRYSQYKPKGIELYLFFFLLASLVHYRGNLFFRADEWHFLERFKEHGLSAIFISHNEHFIPVFSLFYYLESIFFSAEYRFYIATSILLHALNAYLLYKLLSLLCVNLCANLCAKKTPLCALPHLSAALYTISGLHMEVLQWAIGQTILLCTTFLLFGFISALQYLFSSKQIYLARLAICSTLAPLCFGLGFLFTPFLCLILILFPRVYSQGATLANSSFFDHSFSRIKLIAIAFFAQLIAFCLFYTFRNGAGHKLDPSKFPLASDILEFSLIGGLYGSITRGLGLLWYEVGGTPSLIRMTSFIGMPLNEYSGAVCGILLSIVIVLITLVISNDRKSSLSSMTFGYSIIFLSLFFIALGRASFGLSYAFSPRYHSLPMIGLLFFLLPIILAAFNKLRDSPTCKSALVFSLLYLHVYNQLIFSHYASALPQQGTLSRTWLRQWQQREANTSKVDPLFYRIGPEGARAQVPILHPEYISNLFD